MKKLFLMVLSAALFAASVASAAPETTLRFAGQLPPDHPATGYMRQIADEIKDRTNGRIEVVVYPANQLGDYTLVHQELMRGTIDMAMISIPGDVDPRVDFVYIHCLALDYDEMAKFFEPGGWAYKKMDEFNSNLGVKFLGFHPEGFVGVASTRELNAPLDTKAEKGALTRVPNMQTHRDAAEACGFRTVSIPYSDLYTAMQTGVCDAVHGLPPTAAFTILKDVTKYWYQFNFCMEVFPAMISMKTWEKLSPEDQKIIEEACAKTALLSVKNAQRDDEASMQKMRDAGIKVYTYTAEELAPIREAVISTWPRLEGVMTKEFIEELISEVRK